MNWNGEWKAAAKYYRGQYLAGLKSGVLFGVGLALVVWWAFA